MKVNKYLSFAFVYFFINPVGLPMGLLYTTLLTPIFYIWMVVKGRRLIIIKFFVFATPFILNHILNGVDLKIYLRSLLLILSVYIFSYAFYTLVSKGTKLESIFKKISLTNFILTLAALLFLITPYRSIFWSDWTFSYSAVYFNNLPRLQMLTYEPSYYATLLVPFFAFYFIEYVLRQYPKHGFLNLLMVLFPLMLSFSFGVLSGLFLSIGILFFINFPLVITSKKLFYSFVGICVVSLITVAALLVFYRDNPFFVRLLAFIGGSDTSGRSRTSEAFQLAYLIAKEKSVWWGVGPGQLKILGDPIIREFYRYTAEYGQVSIPNAVAETLGLYGIIGVAVRLFVQLYLFFKTRVLNNYFRTLLFIYIFIYQFTGSFTTNIAEYVIWILAFTNTFPQFDKKRKERTMNNMQAQ